MRHIGLSSVTLYMSQEKSLLFHCMFLWVFSLLDLIWINLYVIRIWPTYNKSCSVPLQSLVHYVLYYTIIGLQHCLSRWSLQESKEVVRSVMTVMAMCTGCDNSVINRRTLQLMRFVCVGLYAPVGPFISAFWLSWKFGSWQTISNMRNNKLYF